MSNVNLLNKKILFIAPTFFGYEKKIITQMEMCGATVVFIQENIDSTTFKEKIVNKFPKKYMRLARQKHFKSQIDKVSGVDFDIVFGIRMDTFDDVILSYIRSKFKRAYYVCYFWDSENNMRNASLVASYFDKVLTFDREDAMVHNDWIFRPLFYCDEYKDCNNAKKVKFDILFVASLSPERAKMYIKLNEMCRNTGLSMYTYFYCKPYVFFMNYFREKFYRDIPRKIIHGVGMETRELLKLYSESRSIFDCSSIYQSGLTMRTIECFGAKKKMITTNQDVKNYDIYDSNNILVVSDGNIDSIPAFLDCTNEYEIQSEELYHFYSLQGWIESIFGDIESV